MDFYRPVSCRCWKVTEAPGRTVLDASFHRSQFGPARNLRPEQSPCQAEGLVATKLRSGLEIGRVIVRHNQQKLQGSSRSEREQLGGSRARVVTIAASAKLILVAVVRPAKPPRRLFDARRLQDALHSTSVQVRLRYLSQNGAETESLCRDRAQSLRLKQKSHMTANTRILAVFVLCWPQHYRR